VHVLFSMVHQFQPGPTLRSVYQGSQPKGTWHVPIKSAQLMFAQAPDGIHDVRIISQMRGGITRRQARGSKRRTSHANMRSISESSPTSAAFSPTTGDKWQDLLGMKFNKMPWWITGVINDLPKRLDDPNSLEPSLDGPVPPLKADVDEKQRVLKGLEAGRAADLALREILNSIHEARLAQSR
jgi:hypothetical protein